MMVIINLYLACTALVLMLIEDAPMMHDHGLSDDDGPAPSDAAGPDAAAPHP